MEHSIFQELDRERPAEEYEAILHSYLLRQAESYRDNPAQGEQIAYEVAGILSSEAAQHIGPEYREILELAGQLELPEEQRESGASWDVFMQKVSQLNPPPHSNT